jgi:hypothetical protein
MNMTKIEPEKTYRFVISKFSKIKLKDKSIFVLTYDNNSELIPIIHTTFLDDVYFTAKVKEVYSAIDVHTSQYNYRIIVYPESIKFEEWSK